MDQAYKGYLIRKHQMGRDGYWIEKDGAVIQHVTVTVADAKQIIDKLTEAK